MSASACPYDAYPTPAIVEDPYPFYAYLREQEPVYTVPGSRDVILSRYEDLIWVARNPGLFANDKKPSPDLPEQRYTTTPTLVDNDPPRHDTIRKLAFSILNPARTRGYAPFVQREADRLIDGFAGRGSIELMSEFALPLPLAVIAAILGVPTEDLPMLTKLSNDNTAFTALAPFLPEEEVLELRRSIVKLTNYCGDLAAERRRNPVDDGISELASARGEDGEYVATMGELAHMTRLLIRGGIETSAALITSAVGLLMRTPGGWTGLDEKRRAVRVIEESLRVESPAQWTTRTAKEDITLHGRVIPRGTRILMMWASGNRDAGFEEPDRFEPERPDVRKHLAFGIGIHFCVGAPLARLEGVVALQSLYTRLSGLRLAPGAAPAYAGNGDIRMLPELPLVFEEVV